MKGIPPDMSQQELEEYFAKRYGAIRSVKIAKDGVTGMGRGYGFVWFEKPEEANAAMLDFKGGNTDFKLEWYKVRA